MLSRSTAHRIENDPRMPTKDQVKAFAKACGETSNTNLRPWGRAAEQVQRALTSGSAKPEPEVTEQLEVYRHPVRYVLGKRSEEEVLSELRVRITPKVKTAVAASIFAGTITAAGRVLVRSHRPARALMIASIGGYACGVVTKNSSLDESVERVIGRKLSTVKLEERIAAALARVTLAITPKGLWETKNGRRFLRK